jgi:hypothetical protein
MDRRRCEALLIEGQVPHPFALLSRRGWETTYLDPPEYYLFGSLSNPSRRIKTALTRFADNNDPAAHNDRMPNLHQIDPRRDPQTDLDPTRQA